MTPPWLVALRARHRLGWTRTWVGQVDVARAQRDALRRAVTR